MCAVPRAAAALVIACKIAMIAACVAPSAHATPAVARSPFTSTAERRFTPESSPHPEGHISVCSAALRPTDVPGLVLHRSIEKRPATYPRVDEIAPASPEVSLASPCRSPAPPALAPAPAHPPPTVAPAPLY